MLGMAQILMLGVLTLIGLYLRLGQNIKLNDVTIIPVVRLADDRLAVLRLGLSIYHWNVRIETLTYLFDLRFDPEIGSSTLSWSQEGQYTCQS